MGNARLLLSLSATRANTIRVTICNAFDLFHLSDRRESMINEETVRESR